MVIVKLMGGLGNQMFQYAAGRRLTHVLGTELKLDISGYENYNLRKYELGSFNILEDFASSWEVKTLTSQKNGALARLVRCVLRRPKDLAPSHIRESYFHFDSEILNLPNNVYLDGYWQCEKYFVDICDIIMKEFSIKTPQTGKNKKLAELITSCNAVSIHIRRGDYVSNPIAYEILGVCSLAYYQAAIEKLTHTINQPYFFVFSDDIEWVRHNLRLDYPATYVANNGVEKNYEDLRLMSQCKYHVIANSSFSWWAAWLCTYPSKIVMAPQEWFNNANYDTIDLIPAEWIRV